MLLQKQNFYSYYHSWMGQQNGFSPENILVKLLFCLEFRLTTTGFQNNKNEMLS